MIKFNYVYMLKWLNAEIFSAGNFVLRLQNIGKYIKYKGIGRNWQKRGHIKNN